VLGLLGLATLQAFAYDSEHEDRIHQAGLDVNMLVLAQELNAIRSRCAAHKLCIHQ
jgi:hypothetical protein